MSKEKAQAFGGIEIIDGVTYLPGIESVLVMDSADDFRQDYDLDAQDIAGHKVLGGDYFLFAVPYHNGGVGREFHKPSECARGFALALCFEQFAQSDKGENHCRRFEIKPVQILHLKLSVSA